MSDATMKDQLLSQLLLQMGIQQCIILSQGRAGVISYHNSRGSQNGVGGCEYACSDLVGVSQYREAVLRYT